MKKQSKALITGSHGFIGTHLKERLKALKFSILTIPNSVLSTPAHLTDILIRERPDYIFHLAAYGNMAEHKDRDKIVWGNYIKTYNLLQATKDIPYKSFVNVSSSSVELPFLTLYAATKLGVEALCRSYISEFNKPIVTIRPASVYGEGEADFRLIPTIFRSIYQETPMPLSLAPTHDWIYVGDVVELMINSSRKIDQVKGESINCGTGFVTTNEQIANIIVNLTGKQLDVQGEVKRNFDTPNWKLSLSKYTGVFGGATISLKDGLRRCMEYYRVKYEK